MPRGLWCKQGHEVTDANGYRRKDGRLMCRTCHLERSHRNWWKNRDARLARKRQWQIENAEAIRERYQANRERRNQRRRENEREKEYNRLRVKAKNAVDPRFHLDGKKIRMSQVPLELRECVQLLHELRRAEQQHYRSEK